jgi:hypothetical protein
VSNVRVVLELVDCGIGWCLQVKQMQIVDEEGNDQDEPGIMNGMILHTI